MIIVLLLGPSWCIMTRNRFHREILHKPSEDKKTDDDEDDSDTDNSANDSVDYPGISYLCCIILTWNQRAVGTSASAICQHKTWLSMNQITTGTREPADSL